MGCRTSVARGQERAASLLTNHALVLVALHQNPDARQRDIAARIGVTQGAVQRLLHDLIESGHVHKIRVGRRNRYNIDMGAPMRHPINAGQSVASLLALFVEPTASSRNGQAA